MFCRSTVTRAFHGGELLVTHGKTLASEEAGYKYLPVMPLTGARR